MVIKNQDELIVLPDIDYLISYEQLNALLSFERLWTDLSVWLRSMLISTAEGLRNREAVMYRLHSVISDFYNIFRVFYGPLISQQFSDMLTRFVTNARLLVESMKAGDQAGVDAAAAQMYRAADDLSSLFARINIYWDQEQWNYLLYQFVRMFIEETVAMLSGDFEQEIIIYERLDDLTDIMGSYMARGIIARSVAPSGTS